MNILYLRRAPKTEQVRLTFPLMACFLSLSSPKGNLGTHLNVGLQILFKARSDVNVHLEFTTLLVFSCTLL
jgi:hypothetical protein